MRLRRILYSISILMAIALCGLLVVQFFWIRESYHLKKGNFDQLVRTTINETLQKENYRSQIVELTEILPGIIDDSVRFYFESKIGNRVFMGDDSIPGHSGDTSMAFVYVSKNTWNDDQDESVTIISTDENSTGVRVSVNSDGNHHVVTHSDLEDLRSLKLELAEKQEELDALRAEMHQRIAQDHEELNEQIEHAGKLLEQMAIEYSLKQTGSMNRVAPDILMEAVNQNLAKKGIGLDLDMSIYDPVSDSVIWGSSDTPLKSDTEGVYEFDLFPDDIIDKPERLLISIPDRGRYILGSMWLMMLVSVLITGLVVSAGVYSVHTLFMQKRLADVKSDFINNMTHEFKTPISTISVATDSLVNESVVSDPERIRYYANIIGEENRKMNSNVENILQLALFDKGEVELNTQEINVNEFVSDAVRVFDLRVRELSGVITIELADEPPMVMADPEYLGVVISNLIDNAIKYSGKNPPFISVGTALSGDQVIITVRDEGIGMSAEEQKHIFDKFFRVSGGVIHDVKGFGLGLSYVKMIISAHGGAVEVRSQKGSGSEFIVRLNAS